MCQQIRELKSGKTIEQPVYSYITCSRSTTETVTVEPADVIIVEGILIFTCKELPWADLAQWYLQRSIRKFSPAVLP